MIATYARIECLSRIVGFDGGTARSIAIPSNATAQSENVRRNQARIEKAHYTSAGRPFEGNLIYSGSVAHR
jgi:hypothetical protein